jgi:hypothetical protein
MLFVQYADGSEWTAHVGTPAPACDSSGGKVVMVQADGDELSYIRDNTTNLPIAAKSVVSWFGDQAAFIVSNLF